MVLRKSIDLGFTGLAGIPSALRHGERSAVGNGLTMLAIFAGIFFMVLSFDRPDLYRQLIREDGPVEYGSAILWLLAACVVGTTFAFSKGKTKLFILTYFAAAAFFIACCGEEISWGQRIFGFNGPETITSINKQQETTLHNIGSISVFANLFLMISVGLFIAYPYCVANRPGWKSLVMRHRLPVVDPLATFIFLACVATWIFVGVRFGTLGSHPFTLWGYYNQMDDEIFEFFVAYSFLSFMLLDFAYKRGHARNPAPIPKKGCGIPLGAARAAR